MVIKTCIIIESSEDFTKSSQLIEENTCIIFLLQEDNMTDHELSTDTQTKNKKSLAIVRAWELMVNNYAYGYNHEFDEKTLPYEEGRDFCKRMTAESHPEVMELYNKTCSKKGWKPKPVYILDFGASDELRHITDIDIGKLPNAFALKGIPAIFMLKSLVDKATPEETCLVMMHENRHLTLSQTLGMIGIAESVSIPLRKYIEYPSILALYHNHQYEGTIAAAVAARIINFAIIMRTAGRYAEQDSDKHAAQNVGPEIALSAVNSLKEDLLPAYRKGNLDPSPDNRFYTPLTDNEKKASWVLGKLRSLTHRIDPHPPLEKRLAAILKTAESEQEPKQNSKGGKRR